MGEIPRHLTADTVSCKQLPTVTTRATCLSKVESGYFRANVSLLESYSGDAQLGNLFQATYVRLWPSQPPLEIRQSPGRALPNCFLGQWEVRELRVFGV